MQSVGDPASGLELQLPKLGLDVYSLRSQSWTPFQYLDFAHAHGVEVVHFGETSFLGGLESDHLLAVAAFAAERGISLEVGMGSICESSTWFARDQGTGIDQLSRMLDVAQALGSSIVRCYQGSAEDRPGPSGGGELEPQSRSSLDEHMADTIRTCRLARQKCLDLGIKIAIENHAGGLQSRQVRTLIEEAGPDYVGAVFDAGNAMWTLETPMIALETLAPYTLTSHIRDSAVWEVPEGLAVQWCQPGRGVADIPALATRFTELCPGKPFNLEIINVTEPRIFRYKEPGFWGAYQDVPAWTFAALLEVARHGHPYESGPEEIGTSAAKPVDVKDRVETDALRIQREREDVEAALDYTSSILHGVRSVHTAVAAGG